MVRPVLSCPYCGAFRSAVSLDGTAVAPPRSDGELPGTDDRAPDEALRPADAAAPSAIEDETLPADAWTAAPPADPGADVTYLPAEPLADPDRSAPPRDAGEPGSEEDAGPEDDAPQAPPGPPAPDRIRDDRAVLGAVPAAARAGEPAAPRGPGRVEPSLSGGRQRPLAADARRTGRLDRGAAAPVTDDDAPVEPEHGEGAAPEPPREPAVPRPPARRRRAGPDLSRRRAGEAAAAGSAWLASGSDRDAEEDDPSIDDVLRDAEHEPRRRGWGRSSARTADADGLLPEEERRRGGKGGWIALLLFLLVIAGGVGYAAYWIDKAGIADLLRSPNREVSSLGEADEMTVPADWTSVVTPGAGGATEVLVTADGPFRMRVDGTVYTLDGSTAVRVPVKTSTLLELKALGDPVTASITRLGEAPAAQ
ncbi:hypothetical protein [Amorphus sp. MBR-141]